MVIKPSYELITKYRLCLFAIAMLWIFVRHCYFFEGFSFGLFAPITNIGDCGVDIFLFLSGYGLVYSYKKYDYIGDFYKKRLLRITPTFFLLLCAFGLVDSFLPKYPWYNIIRPSYWLNCLYIRYWYVLAIIVFYLLFPYIVKTMDKVGGAKILIASYVLSIAGIVIVKILNIDNFYQLVVYFARIPVCIIGIYFAKYDFWKNETICLAFLLSLPMVYLLTKDYQRIAYSLFVIPVICFFPFLLEKMTVITKGLNVIGKWSLEFYIIHLYLFSRGIFEKINNYTDSYYFTSLLLLFVTLVLSYISNILIDRINKIISK